MAWHDIALLVLSVAVATWYVTYCIATGCGIIWDAEEAKEEREENEQ